MIIALSIRDFVLIDALDVSVHHGFTTVTGETGAGKSLMLQAIRFVLGGKAEKRIIRTGAERTSVSASFELNDAHPVSCELKERGLWPEDGLLTLRRVLNLNGPSRVYLNDQIISADLAGTLGEHLIEIHGQHDTSALLNVALHKTVLDEFAQAGPFLTQTASCFEAWDKARKDLRDLEARKQRQDLEIQQTQQLVEEMEALMPQDGEAARLGIERAILVNSQKLTECVTEADEAVRASNAANVFGSVARNLERAFRLPELAEAPADNPQVLALKAAQESVERALIEINEAMFTVENTKLAFEHDPDALETVENRLFALRAAGRKFGVDPDALPALWDEARDKLNQLEAYETILADAREAVTRTEMAYLEASGKLSALRHTSAEKLSAMVMEELGPLKLDRARFRVHLEDKPIEKSGADGRDDIRFEVQTNPGAPFGALHKIASGGELARFTLALRVCLADICSTGIMIFDEADQGVGGAVAAAIGERLQRLSQDKQVIAITHSPQVASTGDTHWHISKRFEGDDMTASKLSILEGRERQEEIARMLSGSEITNEARAAAERLMETVL